MSTAPDDEPTLEELVLELGANARRIERRHRLWKHLQAGLASLASLHVTVPSSDPGPTPPKD
jgi:hypothetical protein